LLKVFVFTNCLPNFSVGWVYNRAETFYTYVTESLHDAAFNMPCFQNY